MRLERAIGASRSRMPPLMFFCGFARVALLILFTPSTTARPLSGSTLRIFPWTPRSFPVRTTTRSSFRIRSFPVYFGCFFFMVR